MIARDAINRHPRPEFVIGAVPRFALKTAAGGSGTVNLGISKRFMTPFIPSQPCIYLKIVGYLLLSINTETVFLSTLPAMRFDVGFSITSLNEVIRGFGVAP